MQCGNEEKSTDTVDRNDFFNYFKDLVCQPGFSLKFLKM